MTTPRAIHAQTFGDAKLEQLQNNVRSLRDYLARASFGVIHPVLYQKTAADALASTATSALPIFVAPVDCVLKTAFYITSGTIARNASNYATLKLVTANGEGGTSSEALAFATSASDVLANDWVAFTGNEVVLEQGHALFFQITKAGTGVVVPAGLIQAIVEVA